MPPSLPCCHIAGGKTADTKRQTCHARNQQIWCIHLGHQYRKTGNTNHCGYQASQNRKRGTPNAVVSQAVHFARFLMMSHCAQPPILLHSMQERRHPCKKETIVNRLFLLWNKIRIPAIGRSYSSFSIDFSSALSSEFFFFLSFLLLTSAAFAFFSFSMVSFTGRIS